MTSVLYGIDVPRTTQNLRPDDPLDVHEAAAVLGVNVKQVRELLATNRLRGWKTADDRTWRVRRDDVEAYRDGQSRPPRDEATELLEEFRHREGVLLDQLDALTVERNRALLRLNEQGHSVTALAVAAHMSRQRTSDLLRITRAELPQSSARRRARP